MDLEQLILDRMAEAQVSETKLKAAGVIASPYGEDLSWAFLCELREHPLHWTPPTDILWGSKDHLTSYETITAFALAHGAKLTVMEDGEHWFHTREQMAVLDRWLLRSRSPLPADEASDAKP